VVNAHQPTRRRLDANPTRIGQWALVDDAYATTTRQKVGKIQLLNILANALGVGVCLLTGRRDADENGGHVAD